MKDKKIFNYILWFLLGALCFFISQPLIRMPLLSYVQGTTVFTMFSYLHPLLAGSIIGLSAGIAEESFRFLFKFFLLKPPKSRVNQPVIFGLGHGIMEAAIVLIPPLIAGYSLLALSWGIIERILTVALHVTLTIIVWNGFQQNRKFVYLLAAVLIHGIIDTSIVFFLFYNLSVPLIELIYAVTVVILTVYAVYSKKYYIKEIHDEKEV